MASALLAPISSSARSALGAVFGQAQPSSLEVYQNDTVTLSYDNEQFKSNYRVVNPKTIDEVKTLMGVPTHITKEQPRLALLPSSLPSAAMLADSNTRLGAVKSIRAAAREFVMGNPGHVAPWTSLINQWLAEVNVVIHLAWFLDITVNDGGTLVIAPDTHILVANAIRMYGSGSIVAQGDLTIDCQSLQGNLSKMMVSPAAFELGAAKTVYEGAVKSVRVKREVKK